MQLQPSLCIEEGQKASASSAEYLKQSHYLMMMMDRISPNFSCAHKNVLMKEGDVTSTKASVQRDHNINTNCSDTNALSAPTSPRSFTKHRVSFSEVHVHEFAQWLGDNPSVSQGPPIALSWNRVNTTVIKIDDYETSRGRRRSEQELITCVQQRINIIKWCLGYSDDEISEQERQISKFRKSRESSVKRYRRTMKLQNALSGIKLTNFKLPGL